MTLLDLLSILPWILVGLGLVTLAVLIWTRQKIIRVARLFCLMISLVALWMLGFGVMFHAGSPEAASMFARIGLIGVALLPAAIYDFTATALRIFERRRIIVATTWSISTLFVLALITTDLILDPAIQQFAWGYYPRFTPLGGISFIVYFIAGLIITLAEYVREYSRTTDRNRRQRLRRLAFGFAIVYLAAIDFEPLFGVDRRPIGFLPILAFLVFAWPAIRRHRLQNITAESAASEILATMADALFVIDADGRIRVVNGAVESTFGYSEAEIVGKSIDVLEYVNPEETISRHLRQLLRRAPVRDDERLFRHKRGQPIEVSISISPLREQDIGGAAVVIVRDIRERKRDEEALRRFTTQLQQSNRELEDFAYVASHDLQEPLRKIQAFGDRLRTRYGKDLPEEAHDYLARMQNAAVRMQALINGLLLFSRVTTRGQPFVPVELNTLIEEVLHDLELRVRDLEATVELGELPTIDADPLQMRQLFQNLISNALKFHKEEIPPVVTIHAERRNGEVEISVSDNGIGFDPKYAERIFTIFERLHGRAVYDGTGIGLAICRKIAERHGGRIEARSRPGAGATFTVRLPMKPDSEGGADG